MLHKDAKFFTSIRIAKNNFHIKKNTAKNPKFNLKFTNKTAPLLWFLIHLQPFKYQL